jgi:hypothetical protein
MSLEARAHITCVDLWTSESMPWSTVEAPDVLDGFDANMTRLGLWGRVTALRGDSRAVAEMWRNPVGLLFIDASHEYEDVRADYLAWGPHVVPGGMIAFHDYGTERPGVVQAVDEVVVPSGLWEDPSLLGTLWTARRVWGRG